MHTMHGQSSSSFTGRSNKLDDQKEHGLQVATYYMHTHTPILVCETSRETRPARLDTTRSPEAPSNGLVKSAARCMHACIRVHTDILHMAGFVRRYIYYMCMHIPMHICSATQPMRRPAQIEVTRHLLDAMRPMSIHERAT